jgi:hypothetical protein
VTTPIGSLCVVADQMREAILRDLTSRAGSTTSGQRRGGKPAFVPTPSERQAMSGLRMSADEICKVIGSGRNSATGAENGRPISKNVLFKYFKNELANGRSMLKARVAGKFYHALDNDLPWAIQMAMRNQFGWDAGRAGFQIDPASLADERQHSTVMVEFVVPGRHEPQPIDVLARLSVLSLASGCCRRRSQLGSPLGGPRTFA